MPERQKNWWEYLVDYYARPFSDWLTLGAAEAGWHNYDSWREGEQNTLNEITQNAESDPTATQGAIANSGISVSPEYEKWLDNLIAQQNTQSARDWEEKQASLNLIREAQQLQQLGLSSSGVLQTGGSSVNSVAAADNSKSNIAMQRYQQRMSLAKSLLSMTSSMASAGIYGSAIGAARKASGIVTSAASNSALSYLRSTDPVRRKRLVEQMIKDNNHYVLDQLPDDELPF